ncbi:hypothetical protein PBPRA0775 [Photobacterium profundum SS9]|uniref:Uncharacterized protein n=1 Tax=Photobacterium profundum (strain SS9) TaxID=298386 RepID=Q6LU37_PHOPR|nr:hypothetical protein PBPRA0775 [Photobacterium profundum SS9]
MNSSFTFPIPWIKSVRSLAPKLGAGSISVSEISITSLTASTSTPISRLSPSLSTSTITIQLRLVTGVVGQPKRIDKSIMGTTLPRTLITPRTNSGTIGTFVNGPYSMISLIGRILMANSSFRSKNVKNCCCSNATSSSLSSRVLDFFRFKFCVITHPLPKCFTWF